MKIPEGMTEQEVTDIINKICRNLAKKFKFGYYGIDDLKQEGWIYAIGGLEDYDPSRGPLENFLVTHIRNRFLNLKRNKMIRKRPACPYEDDRCGVGSFWCDKCEPWRKRNETKRNLMELLDIDVACEDTERNMVLHFDVLDKLTKQEIFTLLDEKMPASLRPDYRRMLDGVKLPKQRMADLMQKISDIIALNYTLPINDMFEEYDGV